MCKDDSGNNWGDKKGKPVVNGKLKSKMWRTHAHKINPNQGRGGNTKRIDF